MAAPQDIEWALDKEGQYFFTPDPAAPPVIW